MEWYIFLLIALLLSGFLLFWFGKKTGFLEKHEMNSELKNRVLSDFSEADYEFVISKMESITLGYVMNGQKNLENTWSAMLLLSKGDLNKLEDLIDVAKIDFRDVILWATLESEKEKT